MSPVTTPHGVAARPWLLKSRRQSPSSSSAAPPLPQNWRLPLPHAITVLPLLVLSDSLGIYSRWGDFLGPRGATSPISQLRPAAPNELIKRRPLTAKRRMNDLIESRRGVGGSANFRHFIASLEYCSLKFLLIYIFCFHFGVGFPIGRAKLKAIN